MDYKAYALMAILLASVASVTLIGAAYAQTTLTVETDKDSYATGDMVTVTGQLTATNINQPILIQVTNPQGGFARLDQFDTAEDGSYTYTFRAGGKYMSTDGTYTVNVSYKGTTSEETTFEFDAEEESEQVWQTFIITVGDQSFPVQYMIIGGTVEDMVPSEELSSLTVTITSTANGTLDIRLPRNVIDARTGDDGRSGDDDEFVVLANEASSDAWKETNATDTVRTLSIDFMADTESIEIVGTWAIPEFGAIAAIVLAVAIVGIIVATARYGKFNFTPRL